MDTLTFKPTTRMISSAKLVFMAMAYTKTVRPIVEGYQRRILSECNFTTEEGDLVIDNKRSYRMKDSDFKDYDQFCQDEARKAGFIVPAGYCPLLMAEEQERVAKRNLANVMLEYLRPMMPDLTLERLLHRLDDYNKFIDLNLKLLAPYVKTERTV